MATQLPNPLLELHEHRGAEFQAYGPVQIVSIHGEGQAEYASLHQRCGLMDEAQRALIELSGADRLSFLNRLVTNQTFDPKANSGLVEGSGVYAFLLNPKGRILADMNILSRPGRVLLEVDGRGAESLLALLEKYHFSEKVQIRSLVGQVHELGLFGPGAARIVRELSGGAAGELSVLGSATMQLLGAEVMVWRDDPTGTPGFHLIVPMGLAAQVWNHLLERFGQSDRPGQRDLRPVGWAMFNAARIEAGRPIFGIDFDESVLPAETGLLDQAVSFTKGCYVGQEIVARMQSRDQFVRRLVGLRMETDALPVAGAGIFDQQEQQIGGITSSTISPRMSNRAIALGYVTRAFVAPGTAVRVPAEGAMRSATVTELCELVSP